MLLSCKHIMHTNNNNKLYQIVTNCNIDTALLTLSKFSFPCKCKSSMNTCRIRSNSLQDKSLLDKSNVPIANIFESVPRHVI